MIRNLKALGLALAAICAMSAMTASAASATDFFTAETETAWLTGTSHNNKFEITNGGPKFECTTSRFAATVTDGDSEATVLPNFTGTLNQTPHTTHCNSSSGNVTIDVNHCHFVLTGNTTGHDLEKVDATVWVQCGAKPIEITSSLGPVIKVPSQTPTTGGVTYTNLPDHSGTTKDGVRVTATATGITFTCAPAFTCGLAGVPTHGNNSDYTGTVDITGYEDLNSTPKTTEEETNQLTNPLEGSKINIEWS